MSGFNMIVSTAIWTSSGGISTLCSLDNLWIQEAAESVVQLINPPMMVSDIQQKAINCE